MIKILSFNGTPAEYFEDYNELFECIITIENLKLVAKCPDLTHPNWSFIIYPPKRVSSLRTIAKNAPAAVHEAFDENLPLIEVCTGDCHLPLYIVATPNIDINYLKKNWCIDYCTFHHLLVREL